MTARKSVAASFVRSFVRTFVMPRNKFFFSFVSADNRKRIAQRYEKSDDKLIGSVLFSCLLCILFTLFASLQSVTFYMEGGICMKVHLKRTNIISVENGQLCKLGIGLF